MKTTSAQVAAEVILNGMENNQFRVFVGSDSKDDGLLLSFDAKTSGQADFG